MKKFSKHLLLFSFTFLITNVTRIIESIGDKRPQLYDFPDQH